MLLHYGYVDPDRTDENVDSILDDIVSRGSSLHDMYSLDDISVYSCSESE